jgi:teichuronic acid biosynthesis glycosyltransferase TuaG
MSLGVSIIMPVFNSAIYISKSIKSVLCQSHTNFQLIIVDDCSTDNSLDVISEFLIDSRIELYVNESNKGAAYTRNVALTKVKFNFIAFLDSDDIWLEDKLKVQVNYMLENNSAISYGSYSIINKNDITLKNHFKIPSKLTYQDYLKNTIIGMSTSMVNTNITGVIFFENFRRRQDTILWLNLLKQGFTADLYPGNYVLYRARKDSLSGNKFKAVLIVFYIYWKHENLNIFRAFYFFINYLFNSLRKNIF